MLRELLSLMNPYKNGRRRKKQNILQRVRTEAYSWGIRLMWIFYKRYAYADIIDFGDIKIHQSRRDPQFEQWIRQMGIDVGPRMQLASQMPTDTKISWWRPFYKFFHLETVTKISRGKDVITLDRTHGLTLTTNLKGRLKLSDDEDIIQRSEFVVNALPAPKKVIEEVPKPPKKKKGTKVSLGETKPILPPTKPVTPPTKPVQPPAKPIFPPIEKPKPIAPTPPTKQLRGAEVDESF